MKSIDRQIFQVGPNQRSEQSSRTKALQGSSAHNVTSWHRWFQSNTQLGASREVGHAHLYAVSISGSRAIQTAKFTSYELDMMPELAQATIADQNTLTLKSPPKSLKIDMPT